MARYRGFADLSKAEHQLVCKLSLAARKRNAKPRPKLKLLGDALSIERQWVESGKALILLRLKRFIREQEKGEA